MEKQENNPQEVIPTSGSESFTATLFVIGIVLAVVVAGIAALIFLNLRVDQPAAEVTIEQDGAATQEETTIDVTVEEEPSGEPNISVIIEEPEE